MNKTSLILIFSSLVFVSISLFIFHTLKKDTPPSTYGNSSVSSTLIIAFGDSLTAGYGLPLSESYPAQLESQIRAKGFNVTVRNAGISGETTRGNLERAPFIRSQNPSVVLLGIGGNDALRLLPIEETESNLRKILDILTGGSNPPSVMLLQMQAPINVGLIYKQKFDSLYEMLSDEYNIPLIPFITKNIFLNNAYKLEDGIHLNRAGYAKIVEEYMLPELLKIMTKE